MEENITVERAVELIRSGVSRTGTETVPVPQAHGRVLAAPVTAPIDQPPFPRSPLDGYAFHACDSTGASREHPVELRVLETLFAGDWTDREVARGEAVRLMTGAPIPRGCDCVLRHEDTDNGKETVQLYEPLRPWANYCFAGEDFKAGSQLLPAGTRLNGAAMGVLAAAGLDREDELLCVYKHLTCAVFCTGSELMPGTVRPLPPGKIYSFNETVLRTRLEELGMTVLTAGEPCGDDAPALVRRIRQAAERADVIFTTGGVSVGDRDILHEVLADLGAERIFKGVRLKPGSPAMLSRYRGVPILSLSGNPFAAFATFELFGRPLLAAMTGAEDLLMPACQARLGTPFPKPSRERRFVRGTLKNGTVTLPEGHSSGQFATSALTNCLVDIPAGSGPLSAGETVTILLFT